MALQQSVVLVPGPKTDVRPSVPPTPPKPRRLRETSKTSGSEDTRTPEGSIASQTVRPESEPQSPTSPVSTESASYEPVAHMAWDLDRREQVEINLDDSNETDSEVPPSLQIPMHSRVVRESCPFHCKLTPVREPPWARSIGRQSWRALIG